VIADFLHDRLVRKGCLYEAFFESAGYTAVDRQADPASGDVLRRRDLASAYFAEGWRWSRRA
jgi:hypothetical protein